MRWHVVTSHSNHMEHVAVRQSFRLLSLIGRWIRILRNDRSVTCPSGAMTDRAVVREDVLPTREVFGRWLKRILQFAPSAFRLGRFRAVVKRWKAARKCSGHRPLLRHPIWQ